MALIFYIRIFAAYAIPTMMGVILISSFERGRKLFRGGEKLALGFLLGSGMMSFYLFYIGITGISLNLWTALFIAGPFVLWGFFIERRRGLASLLSFSRPRLFSSGKIWSRILIVFIATLLAWKIFFVCFKITQSPTYFDDSVANYNYKAKAFYYSGSLILDNKHPDFFGGYMPWKAVGVSLFKTWVSLCIGKWSEWAVNLYTLVIFLSLGLIAYYNLVRIIPPLPAYCFTYVILSIPILTFHGAFAYVDIVGTLYLFSGVVYLLRWIREQEGAMLFLSALMLAICVFIKDDLLALFVLGLIPPLILYEIINHRKLKVSIGDISLFVGTVLVLNLPLFAVKNIFGLSVGLPADYRRLEFHPEAFRILASYLFDSGNYNVLWGVFFTVLLFSAYWIRKSELKYLLLCLAGIFVGTFPLFIFTSFFEYLAGGMTINRAVLAFIPLLVLYIALFYNTAAQQAATDMENEGAPGS